jgi:general transcription factor 3C polypeptide 3 (transcription factor C subunit 4)
MEPHHTVPFFQTADRRLQAAYSYGDPRGGSYPDPTELFGGQETEYEEVDNIDPENDLDDDTDSESELIPLGGNEVQAIPDVDDVEESTFEADDAMEIDEIEFDEFPSSESEFERPGQRGRGGARGRGRGRGAGGGTSRGRGARARGRGRGGSRGQGRTARTPRTVEKRTRPTRRRPGDQTGDFDEDTRRRPRKRKRKAPVLSPEFQRLNGLMTQAYMKEDYDEALEYALEAVKLNPEYFPLHGIIAEILDLKGRPGDAIGALFAGVHSSRNPENWWFVVDRLNTLGGDEDEKRQKLGYCYSTLIVLNQNDYQAKLGRAKLYCHSGHHKRARNDCEALLKMNPNDGDVVQLYANVCIEMDDPEVALASFEEFITHCTEEETPDSTNLSWAAISSYVDILIQLEEYDKALKRFKSLSRWILGRGTETFWDDYDDDREWDPYPDPRRKRVRRFRLGTFDENTYGLGLPIEFRVRLGVLRILNSDAADSHFQEGLSHLEYLFPADEDEEEGWQIEDYAELYKEAGDCLRESGHHSEALRFYEPLKSIAELLDSGFYFDLAICYQALDRQDDVRAALDHIRYGENNPSAQIGLAHLYHARGR